MVYSVFMPNRLFALPALLLSFVIACGGGGGDSADPTPAATETPAAAGPGSPEAALTGHAQAQFQKEFAGDCATASAATDGGKICATSNGERENFRAYTVGQVGSQAIQWVILQNAGGQWAVSSFMAITADNADVPGVPWPLRTGVDVVVVGTGNGLNVRTGPGLNADAVDRIDDGTVIRLSAGPAPADDLTWWQVEGRSGWVVADYLRYPDAAGDTPPPAPEATATPVP